MKLINNLTTENKKKKKTTNTSKARVNKNILKQWADENKKTDVKGSMGWFVNMNAGDVEHNIDFFNNMMGSSSSTDIGDSSTGTISSGDGTGISSGGMAEEKSSNNSSSDELMEYSYKWKPSKQARREFAKKMQEIDDFCAKNNITQSRTSDSYYFDIDGQNYRVSNHSVEASNLHSGGKFHSQGREDDTIYIHASKTRLIDIYNDLKAGKKLDGRGNVISEEFISESKQDKLNFEKDFEKELSDKFLFESNQDKERFINYFGKELYNKFLTQKQRLPKEDRDLNKWTKRPPEDLAKLLTSLETKPTRSAARADDLKGATLVSENSEFKCYHITTHEASVLLGRNARWCISMKDDDRHWYYYTSRGIKFYFFIGNNDEKYALALYPRILHYAGLNTNFELFNQQDKEITASFKNYNFPKIPNVDLIFESKYNKDGLYIENNVLIKALPTVTNVVVPEGVTEIFRFAFSDCEKLKSVKLPNSLNIIGEGAFDSCKSLTSIEIPDSVTEIGSSAFVYCSSLKTVRLPKNLKEIEATTFQSCKSLTTLVIPNSVTTIGCNAFYGCSNLTSVVIPSSVTTIGSFAFYGCNNLTSIAIPNSVTTIGYFAFSDCNNLTIYCEETSQPSGWNYRWNPSNRPVVWGYKGDKLEETKESAPALTEARADIEKFKSWLSDDNLFNLYYKLAPRLKAPYKDIYWIMKNSTKEDLKAYLDDLNATKSKSSTKKGDLEGAKLVSENSSYKCYHITTYEASVIMGRGTKWCISMKDDDRHWKSYTAGGIKFYFFIGKNEKLALALYPKKITVDYTDEYDSDFIITNFELFNEEDENISYAISEYNLPQIPGVELVYIDSTETLDENGLYIDNNVVIRVDRNLTQVTIPEGVTEIGESAFKYCYSLENVKLPKSLLSIGDNAFSDCVNLTNIVIPNSVTTIGDYAFYGCNSLTDVVIPNSVTIIGYNAFSGCSSLTSIEIPNSVTTIGSAAFYNCRSLTNIEIPNSVTTIEGYAFSGCDNLKSVVIPDSVAVIKNFAFNRCNNLTIYCESTSQPSGWKSRWNYDNRPVVWGYSTQKQIKENINSYDVWYRGFNADYAPLASSPASGQLYTWLTLDKEYAEEYAKDFNNGKIAVVTLNCSDKDIGSVFDLPDDIDYYAPSDEDFTEFILNENLYGYVFEVDDEYTCICIKKDMCNVIKILDIDNVEPEKTNNTEED